MGEAWHNNHHAFPASARLGLHPGETDPGWWVLVLLSRLGLVWNLKTPDTLPPRPNLVALKSGLLTFDHDAMVQHASPLPSGPFGQGNRI
jgi:hypothetical protein